jgi:hypothetical protein
MATKGFGALGEPSPDDIKAGINQRIADLVRANDDVLAPQLLAVLHGSSEPAEENAALPDDTENETEEEIDPDTEQVLADMQEDEINGAVRASRQRQIREQLRAAFSEVEREVLSNSIRRKIQQESTRRTL